MKTNTTRHLGTALLLATLAGSLLMGSCFLFKGTSAEDDVANLTAEITELTKKLMVETNPETKAQIKKDIAAVKENLEKATKRLIEEGKSIDLKGILDQVNDEIKKLGE